MTDSPAAVSPLMRVVLLLAVTAMAACSREPAAVASSALAPGVFQGDLPCADCPGIRYTLELLPENRYVLRREYLERSRTFEEDGHWRVDAARRMLVLEDEKDAPAQWQIDTSTKLTMLDMEGRPFVSGLNYTLTRRP